MATLDDIIPDPAKRKPIYQVFGALGIVIGAVQVAFAAADAGQPVWLNVALAVYAFLGGAGFTVAQANTGGKLISTDEPYNIVEADDDLLAGAFADPEGDNPEVEDPFAGDQAKHAAEV